MAGGDRHRKLLRTSEVAEALGVDRSTVYRWMRAGVITPESKTYGGQARFDLEKVKRQLAESTEAADGASRSESQAQQRPDKG